MSIGNIILLACIFGVVVGVFILAFFLLSGKSEGAGSDRWATGKKTRPSAAPPKKRPRAARGAPEDSIAVRLVRPLARLWRVGDTSQSRVQELLVHAGIREKGAVEVFLGAKFALAFALPAAVVALFMWRSSVTGAPMNAKHMVMYGAGALIAGMLTPNIWLHSKARKRIDRIRLSLPDTLDLLIVCIESGLGLDGALVRISRELSEVAGEFCDELQLLNLEISAGKPREECLRNLALRTGCDEVESLTARINQAARYGTNLGHSLRIHSESLRQKRRQEAEERAAKTSVKLLFPLVFFIFPAIFIVILGPAVAKVVKMLL